MEGRRSVETKLKFDTISIGQRVGKRSKGIHPRQLYPPITHVSPIAKHIRPVDPLCVPRLFVPAIKPGQTSSSPGSEGQVNPPSQFTNILADDVWSEDPGSERRSERSGEIEVPVPKRSLY